MAKNGKSNGHAKSLPDEIHDELEADISGDTIDVAAETLTGDLRDFILDRLRHEQSKKAWHERSEADQRDVVYQVEAAVHTAVRKAVEIIAAGGLRTIKATIEQVTIKDGIKATLTISRADENRHNLADATGHTVLVVVADINDFTGERAPVDIKPDNPKLPLESVGVVHSETENRADVF